MVLTDPKPIPRLSEEFAFKTIYLTNMPNKEPTIGGATAAADTSRDLSWEREASEATLASLIAETVAKEVTKAHAQYTTWIKENCAPTLPTTLKINSGVNGFKVMDPFDWTQDRDTYQCWQLWV